MSVHQPLSGVLVDSKLACFSVRLGSRKQFGHGSWQDILQTFSTHFCTQRGIIAGTGKKVGSQVEICSQSRTNVFVDMSSSLVRAEFCDQEQKYFVRSLATWHFVHSVGQRELSRNFQVKAFVAWILVRNV